MGYTKEVAEKSLLMTGNQTVDGAMDWIMEHQNDEDFFEEMRIESASTQDPNKPQLTMEEKKKILDERIAKVWEQKRIEEEKSAKEAEINWIKFNKELLVAKRKMEEQQDEIQFRKQQKEREEFERAKKEMQQQLLWDKRERGFKVDPNEEAGIKKKIPMGMDSVKEGYNIISTVYKESNKPGVAKTCFKTFVTISKNILKSPSEEKFRSLNLENAKLQQKLTKIAGSKFLLAGIGFEKTPEGSKMILPEDKIDADLIG